MLTERLDEAFKFAHELHRLQKRKGTSIPYVSHLMAVAAPAGVSLTIWFCSPTSERASRNRMEPMAVRACMLIYAKTAWRLSAIVQPG